MLETVRAYASGCLTPEEAGEIRAAHAGHFVDLIEEAAPHLSDSSQRTWRLRLGADDDNLRAAFSTLTAASDPGRR
jgi:predicted ATPase